MGSPHSGCPFLFLINRIRRQELPPLARRRGKPFWFPTLPCTMFFLNEAKKKGLDKPAGGVWRSLAISPDGLLALHRPVGPLPGVFQPGRAVRGGPPCSLPLAFGVIPFLCAVYVCGAFGGAGSVRGFLSMGGHSHRASVGIWRIPT